MNIHTLSSAPAQSTGARTHSVLDRDAPSGIEQDTWDDANVDERRELIQESEQQTWVSQAISHIEETLLPNTHPWLSRPASSANFADTLFSPLRPHAPDRDVPGTTPYVAQPGDTFTQIANQHDIPRDTLREANRHIAPRRLQPGQIVRIPVLSKPVEETKPLPPQGTHFNYYTSSSEAKYYTSEQYQTLKEKFDWDPDGAGDKTTAAFLLGWYDAYRFREYAKQSYNMVFDLDKPSCEPGSNYDFESNPHNDCRDAFRHAYWSALMARYSASDAKQIGDSHERSVVGPYEETYMDLHNNKIGREIGAANPEKSDKEIEKLIVQALQDGNLMTNQNSIPDIK